ncbi:hypothetical protein [Halotalea alkalilenta]|uniref:hypothetical protein n=1 Tax=Halotalea alkalilenta TaxID=376489 RepID=UPI0004892222|nr:hypothetical protein [Halotalea alkalilenta]
MRDFLISDAAGRQRGASLIEALAAVAIAAVGVTALVAALEAALGRGQLLRERSLGTSAIGMLLEAQRGVPASSVTPAPLGGGVTLCRRADDGVMLVWLVWPRRPGLAPPACSEGEPAGAIGLSGAAP